MKADEFVTYAGNGFMYVLTAIQDHPTFQIIELVLTIITSIVLLLYRLWKWWKEAKKDGKIDKEEIKEGISIIKDGVDEVKSLQKGEKHNGENQ